MHNPLLPEQREQVVILTVIHDGEAFSPSEVYRLRDPEHDPALAQLPTLAEGQTIGAAWRAVGYGCDTCRQGVMQARRRAGVLEVRCTGCGVADAG